MIHTCGAADCIERISWSQLSRIGFLDGFPKKSENDLTFLRDPVTRNTFWNNGRTVVLPRPNRLAAPPPSTRSIYRDLHADACKLATPEFVPLHPVSGWASPPRDPSAAPQIVVESDVTAIAQHFRAVVRKSAFTGIIHPEAMRHSAHYPAICNDLNRPFLHVFFTTGSISIYPV